MQLLTSSFVLFFLSSVLCKHPNTHHQPKRAWSPANSSLTCIFLTSELNWAGERQNLCQVGGQCASSLPDGLYHNVSSAGPSEGQTCFLYTGQNCTGNSSAPLVYPGSAHLRELHFDNKAASWRCWKMCGYAVGSGGNVSKTTVMSTASSEATMMTAHRSITLTLSGISETGVSRTITTTLSGLQPLASSAGAISTSSNRSITTTSSSFDVLPSRGSITTTLTGPQTSSSAHRTITTTISSLQSGLDPNPTERGSSFTSFTSNHTITTTLSGMQASSNGRNITTTLSGVQSGLNSSSTERGNTTFGSSMSHSITLTLSDGSRTITTTLSGLQPSSSGRSITTTLSRVR